jgi:hypothetical protein
MRTISVIKYTFTAVGLGMLLGAFLVYTNTQDFLQSAITTNGTVVELVRSRSSDSITYRPVVEFKTQGDRFIEFTSSSGSNPASYSKGEIVDVLYLESSPEQAKINSFFSLWGGSTILGGLGSLFFIVGLSIIFLGSLKSKKIEWLKKNGISVRAKFQSVEVNTSLEVNGRNPYQICVQWKNPVTAELHIFNSDNIWFDPTEHINTDEITVLIEQNNPKKHHVDISFLPKTSG